MIHLITVVDKVARNFYIEQRYISDFKSVMRSVTSGRVMIVSTKFRSDLFYSAEKQKNKSILKLWSLYSNTNVSNLDNHDFMTSSGDEESLFKYFQSINKLSRNWYYYWLYKKAFRNTFGNDQQNPMAQTIMGCDQYLTKHPSTKRTALINPSEKIDAMLTEDTLALAMRIINNDILSN